MAETEQNISLAVQTKNRQCIREEVVRARIVQINHQGATVRLPSGEEAWLPATELVLGIKTHQDLREVTHHVKNDELDVVVFDKEVHGKHHRKIVSHVRVDEDPWNKVADWPDRVVRVMEVDLVTASRALGNIPPGIRAQVVLDTLRSLIPSALLRPGDRVAGLVHKDAINPEQRIVTLDVAQFVQSDVKVVDALCPSLLLNGKPVDVEPRHIVTLPTGSCSLTSISRVTVIDDDSNLVYAIGEYLERYGLKVTAAYNPSDVNQLLKTLTEPQDVVLIDLHFKGYPPFFGLNLATQVQEAWPQVPIILVTADDSIFADPSILDDHAKDLRICDIVLKPIGAEGLLHIVAGGRKELRRLADVLSGALSQNRPRSETSQTWQGKLEESLEALRRDTNANVAVLFSLHPVSLSAQIVARSGRDNFVSEIEPNVERSPLRDVAIGCEEVFTQNACDHRHFPKHRWLQRAYHYCSCMGIPVHVTSELAYALFVFHVERERFSTDMKPRMHRAATELASTLAAQRMEKRILDSEPYELLGRAYGSMAHDLRHSLSCELTTGRLMEMLNEKTMLDECDLKLVRDQLITLDDGLRQAAEIARTFQQVARGAQEECQEVELLDLVHTFVKEFARQYSRVQKEIVIGRDFPSPCQVCVRPMGLRQALFNLVLNAHQQIDLLFLRKNMPGEVKIELAHEERDKHPWACIRVHDSGPGIHGADFKKIFELGYTTKQGGFGMGLDICRRLVNRMTAGEHHGDVVVRESILFAGTTFEIRIPIPGSREARS